MNTLRVIVTPSRTLLHWILGLVYRPALLTTEATRIHQLCVGPFSSDTVASQCSYNFITALGNQVGGIPGEVMTSIGPGWNMGLKRKVANDTTNGQLLEVPGLSTRRQSAIEVQVDLEAKGSAVMDLFEGNYEERRKFGVLDIFDTLGSGVSEG